MQIEINKTTSGLETMQVLSELVKDLNNFSISDCVNNYDIHISIIPHKDGN